MSVDLKYVPRLHTKKTAAHRLKCWFMCRNLKVKALASQKKLRLDNGLNADRFECSVLVYNPFLQMS